MHNMKKTLLTGVLALAALFADAAEPFVTFSQQPNTVCLTGMKGEITYDKKDWKGVHIAIDNLKEDLQKVIGRSNVPVVIGTLGKSAPIDKLAKKNLIDASQLKGKTEKFIITMVKDQLVIAGSDKRGTIYGIYELSQQIGVSPWYDWADTPVEKQENIYIKKGIYTDGEPAVKYRGIFLNDEAPCLSGWIGENYDGVYNSKFYARVFELVLRLKGNYMWPAMWNSAFYVDDSLNMQTADDMGVCMGTSHHEPMARAHKEWTRNRQKYGAWNYDTNQATLDEFWKGGVARMKHTDDVVTIGMRGDGDEAMGDHADVALLERIVTNQRKLIEEATGKPATAIELPDGTIVTGKTSSLLGASAALLLNALKTLAGIDDALHLIAPEVIDPIQHLKVDHFGNRNPRLHTDEVLIALSICAATDPRAEMAMEQLGKLRGCEVHACVILSPVDEKTFKRLGVNLTCQPRYKG